MEDNWNKFYNCDPVFPLRPVWWEGLNSIQQSKTKSFDTDQLNFDTNSLLKRNKRDFHYFSLGSEIMEEKTILRQCSEVLSHRNKVDFSLIERFTLEATKEKILNARLTGRRFYGSKIICKIENERNLFASSENKPLVAVSFQDGNIGIWQKDKILRNEPDWLYSLFYPIENRIELTPKKKMDQMSISSKIKVASLCWNKSCNEILFCGSNSGDLVILDLMKKTSSKIYGSNKKEIVSIDHCKARNSLLLISKKKGEIEIVDFRCQNSIFFCKKKNNKKSFWGKTAESICSIDRRGGIDFIDLRNSIPLKVIENYHERLKRVTKTSRIFCSQDREEIIILYKGGLIKFIKFKHGIGDLLLRYSVIKNFQPSEVIWPSGKTIGVYFLDTNIGKLKLLKNSYSS